MLKTIAAAEVSVCVSPRGDAAVFVTHSAESHPLLNPARFAAAFAARGLRLVGLSSSDGPVPAGMRSISVASGSLLDAALSLIAGQQPAMA